MSLDIGTMKVTTRLFNEDFINIAKRLDKDLIVKAPTA